MKTSLLVRTFKICRVWGQVAKRKHKISKHLLLIHPVALTNINFVPFWNRSGVILRTGLSRRNREFSIVCILTRHGRIPDMQEYAMISSEGIKEKLLSFSNCTLHQTGISPSPYASEHQIPIITHNNEISIPCLIKLLQ